MRELYWGVSSLCPVDFAGSADGLMKSWRLVSFTSEKVEQRVAQLYDQLTNMTWDGQMELEHGVFKPIIQPYRMKLGIALMVLQRATPDEIRCLSWEDARQLFDISDRSERELRELRSLAHQARVRVNVHKHTDNILTWCAYLHLVPDVVAQAGLGQRVRFQLDACGALVQRHSRGKGADQLRTDLSPF